MIQIAILGYGIVGSGVYEMLINNKKNLDKKSCKKIVVKKILDIRDFTGAPIADLITKDFTEILHDPEIRIVVEVMGGTDPAYTYVKQSLENGKSVVTSNKELVAKHGAELLAIAAEHNVNFLFEASVGGGIPIIRPLNESLLIDDIGEITGILNGTTNYILTKMDEENKEFDEALKRAQEKGYAERNPDADILGHDTCRKIAILLSLAIGSQVNFEDIYTEGITAISPTDLIYAKKLGSAIKLLATAKITDNGVFARVTPALVDGNHPLATVKGVYNAIFVKGHAIGEVMFYGKGAGKRPTASAVTADILDCANHMDTHILHNWSTQVFNIMPFDSSPARKIVRITYNDITAAKQSVETLFGECASITLDAKGNEFAFITPEYTEATLESKIKELGTAPGVVSIPNSIRLYD